MLGSATGTVPKQFLVGLWRRCADRRGRDRPEIIELGRKYFKMEDASQDSSHPNYRVHAEDARYWLANAGRTYDVIGMDAYHQPYIPFHLTTVEFFQQVKQHLIARGRGGGQRRQRPRRR